VTVGTSVALLRGINVGGANRLPMKVLTSIAGGLGWQDLRTYLASGNLLFRSQGQPKALSEALHAAIAQDTGLDVRVLVLPGQVLLEALSACPWTPEDDRHVHLFFLFAPANPKADRIAALQAADEELKIAGEVAYLHAPSGIGRSKLAAQLPNLLGCDATARNLRTVRSLAEMLAE